MTNTSGPWDVVIIGGGIGGLSLAAELASDRRVAVLEKETALAAHTTGKSVATFIPSYGNAAIQELNAASLPFFETAHGRGGEPIATPLPFLYAASEQTADLLDDIYAAAPAHAGDMRFLTADLAAEYCPILRSDWVVRGLVDPAVLSIDVHALIQLHASTVRLAGGIVTTGAEVMSARYDGDWLITDSRDVSYRATTLVNASNAWADTVAARCGARPLGVRPLKRSVFTLDLPEAFGNSRIPMVNAADEEFYFKPDSGQLLCSPADEAEADINARDAERADEFEIARALDGLARATVLDTKRVRATWAGLRCFTPDRTPLVGWDKDVDGLFWHTALGGYGIQTSPGLSRVGAALIRGGAVAESATADLISALDPARYRA